MKCNNASEKLNIESIMQRITEERLIKHPVTISKSARAPAPKLIFLKLADLSYSALFSKTKMFHMLKCSWEQILGKITYLFLVVLPNIQFPPLIDRFCLLIQRKATENKTFLSFKEPVSLSHGGESILGRTKCSNSSTQFCLRSVL